MKPPSQREQCFRPLQDGVRLDRLLADRLGCGRRRSRELIELGLVEVSGRRASASTLVGRETLVRVYARSSPRGEQVASRAVGVLWEDAAYLAVTKPAGLHTLAGRTPDSVAEVLVRLRPQQSEVGPAAGEAGILHRLDRDTSGVLLVAKTNRAYQSARRAFADHEVDKRYLALVAGRLAEARSIDIPLTRLATRVRATRGRRPGYAALTQVSPLEIGSDWTFVALQMSTGVTHQLRAHLALAGHPILGDTKYGGSPAPVHSRDGQLLHASRISVRPSPDVSAPPPEDFLRALARLRRQG